ncbi:unnamed protein product [marine sediment metagenome]|uniref:Uncharacterized protein n=1 Tax=marine sediment metagenome TaxID=412755 RepID=X1AXW2_9ZZZZ
MKLLDRIFNRTPKKVYAVTKDNMFTKEQIITGIQGLEEGQVLDILSTCASQAGYSSTGSAYIDKNNYPTYTNQVQVINMMYNNCTDYGSEMLKAVIKTRVSFIGGEGLSVKADNKKTLKFVTDFLSKNKLLEGSELINNLITGEMEGKDLMQLALGKDVSGKAMIKVRNWSWYVTPYDIEYDEKDTKGSLMQHCPSLNAPAPVSPAAIWM